MGAARQPTGTQPKIKLPAPRGQPLCAAAFSSSSSASS